MKTWSLITTVGASVSRGWLNDGKVTQGTLVLGFGKMGSRTRNRGVPHLESRIESHSWRVGQLDHSLNESAFEDRCLMVPNTGRKDSNPLVLLGVVIW